MGKALDLTGQKYGRLTVLERAENQGREVTWLCQCECGNKILVQRRYLRSGATKSCGCLQKEIAKELAKKITKRRYLDLTGQKYGHLTVIKDTGEKQNKQTVWECECDCENHTRIKVTVGNLRNGHTRSCGCIKESIGEELIKKILIENNLSFIKEKTFNNCRFEDTNAPAKFDFYINNKYIIEIDGIQHFQQVGWDNQKENLFKRNQHDQIKNQYCLEHNIPLYRIPYYDLNNINILEDILQDKYLVKNINHYNLDIEKDV